MTKHLEAAALVALAKANIPTDVQELLISGDPTRGIPPGALQSAMQNVFASLTTEAPEVAARLNSPLGPKHRYVFGAWPEFARETLQTGKEG